MIKKQIAVFKYDTIIIKCQKRKHKDLVERYESGEIEMKKRIIKNLVDNYVQQGFYFLVGCLILARTPIKLLYGSRN